MTPSEYINKKIEYLFKATYVKVALALMVISYFYNLPALKYSLPGANEIRLYDMTGFVIFFIVYKNFMVFNFYILSTTFL
jgi:hypothetical protein